MIGQKRLRNRRLKFSALFAKLRGTLVALDGPKNTLAYCRELLEMAKTNFPVIFSQICDGSIFVKFFRYFYSKMPNFGEGLKTSKMDSARPKTPI